MKRDIIVILLVAILAFLAWKYRERLQEWVRSTIKYGGEVNPSEENNDTRR